MTFANECVILAVALSPRPARVVASNICEPGLSPRPQGHPWYITWDMASKPDGKGDEGRVLEVCGHEITISHPNKIVFPELGATKLELAEHYLSVPDRLAGTA